MSTVYIPPFYSKLRKTNKDLVEKKFDFNEYSFKLTNKSVDGVTIETNGKYNNNLWNGTVKTTIKGVQKYGDLELNFGTDTATPLTTAFTFNKYNGTVAKLELTTKDKDTAFNGPVLSHTVEYTRNNVAGTLNVKTDQHTHKVDTGVVAGLDGFNVGGSVQLNATNGLDLLDYNVAGEYSDKNNTYTVYTTKKLDYLNFAFVNNWTNSKVIDQIFGSVRTRNRFVPTTFGAIATVNTHDAQKHTVTAVAETVLSPTTVVKTRAEYPKNLVDLAIEHKLKNPALTIGFAARFNAKNWIQGSHYGAEKFGISVAFDA